MANSKIILLGEELHCVEVAKEKFNTYYLSVNKFNNKLYFGLVKKQYNEHNGLTTTKCIHIPHDKWLDFTDGMQMTIREFMKYFDCMLLNLLSCFQNY